MTAEHGRSATAAGRRTRSPDGCGATPGCPARWAASRHGSPARASSASTIDRAAHAEDLRAALGGLKGPLMKVAQLLATIPEALPKEYAAELAPAAVARRRRWAGRSCAGAWRPSSAPGWRDKFAEFELDAAAAASLGQVHRATAPDGRKLACKLQYPNIASAVEADLDAAPSGVQHLPALRRLDQSGADLRRARRATARGARLPARGQAHRALPPHAAGRARRCRCPTSCRSSRAAAS